MGQPKFNRKHYDTPSHPWQGERIKAENEVKAKYGLKNKTEIWKAQTILRDMRGQARGLISRARNPSDTQGAKEAHLLIARLQRSGYLGENATLNDVLGMDLERILNRRLQSQVYLKGLARTPRQARQFISHGCIKIGERRVTVPSYAVRRGEEDLIAIDPTKSIADEAHPVRPKAPGQETAPPAAAPATEVAATPEAA
jgi:small subunit ribosomal protein S4